MLSVQYILREFVLSMELSLDAVKCDVRLLLAQYVRPIWTMIVLLFVLWVSYESDFT